MTPSLTLTKARDSKSTGESHLPQIIAVQTILTFLAVTAVALRIYVWINLIKNPGADDLTIIFPTW
jgi:hypothetical protein